MPTYRAACSIFTMLSLSCAALAGGPAGTACPTSQARHVSFQTTEGTQMNLDVSPDGKLIAFDLLGDIYTIPVSGGAARRMTGGTAWDKRPVWSPDGRTIAFISDRSGHDEVYTLDQISAEVANTTVGNRDITKQERGQEGRIRFAEWLDDNQMVIDGWTYATKPTASRKQRVDKFPGESYFSNGKAMYYFTPAAKGSLSIRKSGEASGGYEAWTIVQGVTRNIEGVHLNAAMGMESPAASNDGRWIIYRDRSPIVEAARLVKEYVPTSGETDIDTIRVFNVRNRTYKVLVGPGISEGWRSNGANRHQTGYSSNVRFDISPDSKMLFISYGGHIHQVDILRSTDTVVPISAHVDQCLEPIAQGLSLPVDKRNHAANIRDASMSVSGRELLFASGRRIFVRDLATGTNRMLLDQSTGQFQPSYSPDGKWVAYVTWDDAVGGHLWRVKSDGTGPRQLTTRAGYYQSPTWSPDGKSIGFVGSEDLLVERSGFDSHASKGNLSILSIDTGSAKSLDIAVRFGTKISFSADGSRIYYSPFIRDYLDPLKLFSVSVDGIDKRDEEIDRFFDIYGLATAAVNPNRATLAAVKGGNLYLVDCAVSDKEPNPFGPETCREIRLTATGGNDPIWREHGTILEWSFADQYYRARLSDLLGVATAARKQDISRDVEEGSLSQILEPNLLLADGGAKGFLLLKGAKIISMRGDEVIENGNVLIKNNRIVFVGTPLPLLPPDTKVIDVSGKTIVPGFIDAHAHFTALPRDILAKNHWETLVALAFGTTTAKDPSNGGDHGFAYAELLESGEMIGPGLIGTTAMVADRLEPLRSFDEAKNRARRLQRLGARFVKYHSGFTREQRNWIIQSGRTLGMSAAAHMPTETLGSGQLNLSTIVDGATSSEHELADSYDLFSDVSSFIRQSHVYLCFAPLASNGGYQDRYWQAVSGDPRLVNFYRGEGPFPQLTPVGLRDQLPPLRQEAGANAMFLSTLAKDTEQVLIGSHGDYPGIGMHWEMWAHVRGGMSPHKVLRAATLNVAKSLSVDGDLGSVEQGKLADLLILARDPLADIRNTLSIDMVMKDGVLRESQSLAEVWPETSSLPVWEAQGQKGFRGTSRTQDESVH